MSQPFLAEIRAVGFNFAPTGWALCNGQLLPISQNTALFALIGTYYGGDGKSTFALPNLQGSAPIGVGQGPGLSEYVLGQQGGEPYVTLLQSEMPNHLHTVMANNGAGNSLDPTNKDWAQAAIARGTKMYTANTTGPAIMNPTAFSIAGGSQPHNNLPPYLCLNFIIALQGIFPQRN